MVVISKKELIFRRRLSTCVYFLLANLITPAWAAVELSGTRPTYSESFNGLAAHGSSNVAGVVIYGLPEGWSTVSAAGMNSSYSADNGSESIGGFKSYGLPSAGERCLGTLNSNSGGDQAFSLEFFNGASKLIITHLVVGFAVEQWCNGGSGKPQELTFLYATSPSPFSTSDLESILRAQTAHAPQGTPVPQLGARTPVANLNKGPLNGNLPENRVVVQHTLLLDPPLQPGEHLVLFWFDRNAPGRESGLGIDDLSVMALFDRPRDIATTLVPIPHANTFAVLETATGRFSAASAAQPPNGLALPGNLPLGLLNFTLSDIPAATPAKAIVYLTAPTTCTSAFWYDGTTLAPLPALVDAAPPLAFADMRRTAHLNLLEGGPADLDPQPGSLKACIALSETTESPQAPEPAGGNGHDRVNMP